jgi:hypothetical protein
MGAGGNGQRGWEELPEGKGRIQKEGKSKRFNSSKIIRTLQSWSVEFYRKY